MRHFLIAAAVFVGLAACSPSGEGASEPADAPAALPPGRPAIYAAAQVGPEEFVRALYAVHATPGAAIAQASATHPPTEQPSTDNEAQASQSRAEQLLAFYDQLVADMESGRRTREQVGAVLQSLSTEDRATLRDAVRQRQEARARELEDAQRDLERIQDEIVDEIRGRGRRTNPESGGGGAPSGGFAPV
jgi:hypothetical protein